MRGGAARLAAAGTVPLSSVSNVAANLAWVVAATCTIGAVGVAVMRYHLYEIDCLLSCTLSYAILTAMLAGVFVVVVALTTRLLPFSFPVAVATSTLTAAPLFNPLRRRVQPSHTSLSIRPPAARPHMVAASPHTELHQVSTPRG